MRLKDRVIIVTGAGQGIGREFALGFSQEGAKIVIAEINYDKAQEVAKEIEKSGGEALALKTDVSSERDTRDMARKAVEKFGRIDVLVNNAAIFYGLEMKPFDEVSEEDWDKVMAVNVKGAWQCAKAVFLRMKEQGKGKIINIASDVFTLGIPFLVHYVTSKGGGGGAYPRTGKRIRRFRD